MPYRFLSVVLLTLCLNGNVLAQPADSVLNFITANKSRTSLYLIKNKEAVAKLNENEMMPLAHVLHLLVAIEFCKQAAADMVFEDAKVPLSDLDKYSIPASDDGNNNHDNWLAYGQSKRLIRDDSVRLMDVARGMLLFNDEANAEYLMDLLGFDNITSNLRMFNIEKHSGISPMVASMFLYQNPKKRKEDAIIKEIKKMSDEMYCMYCKQIHNSLETEPGFKNRFRQRDFNANMRKLWSERLTASTAKEYAQIAANLNRRMVFDEITYGIVAEVMETYMENEENVKWLKTAGVIQGNTPTVLTKTLYGNLRKNNTKIEIAYFFNDLTQDEHDKLVKWMPDFDKEVLQSETFRNKIAEAVNK